MLELKQIIKDYPAGNGTVNALRGIDLTFRQNEFVSILGPSGCGKTTMLNIIGGLDSYTSGDLVINGRSTKDFRDRDWDTYRNHSIGFVFQSYNLIPHQSVLQNVELALTLSGVPKSERRRRAKAALERVGLGDQLRKKPCEMSGGQMQRVAIARAIVNDPDIILADEPTGALDTETSLQVMDILQEIAADRLVIMVTHNPELAERYSTRIINMLDGRITGDSRPLAAEEMAPTVAEPLTAKTSYKKKKPSMSLFTSFGLSMKNLFSKKGRTTLTAFAGSIGIIGIALISAVSQGMTAYIDVVQEETMSSYPLTIQQENADLSSLFVSFLEAATSEEVHDNEAVYEKTALYDMVKALNNTEVKKNDLESFKKYLEEQRKNPESPLHSAIGGLSYTYDFDMTVYTESVDGTILQSDLTLLIQKIMAKYLGGMEGMSGMMSASSGMSSMGGVMASSATNMWQEMLTGDDGNPINDVLKEQYDVVYGSWPNAYDEIVLVLDENNELSDMTLYALGLKSEEEIEKIVQAAVDKTPLDDMAGSSYTYEEICNMEFRTVIGADCCTYNAATGTYVDNRETEAGLRLLYNNGIDLKVTGIIRPREDVTAAMLNGSIGYTRMLTEKLIADAQDAAAVQAQLENPNVDIFTGLPFAHNEYSDAEKAENCRTYLAALDDAGKAAAYVTIMSIPDEDYLNSAVTAATANKTRADIEAAMSQALAAQLEMDADTLAEYLATIPDEDMAEYYAQIVAESVKMQYAAEVERQFAQVPEGQLAVMLDTALQSYTDEQCAQYYSEVLTFSDSSYEENMHTLGYVDINVPASINIYTASFEDKDIIEEEIAKYNDSVDEISRISYTDYLGLMMSSITTIINAITYILIAFVAISLIVSSIMIGVITLISVQERTKEIGILRAIGASKRNVSNMFNAETAIIGCIAGLVGVGVSYLLCIPINAIIHALTGIGNLSAVLPVEFALILVGISMLLTLCAGLIPSRSAAKKDPVVALRTE